MKKKYIKPMIVEESFQLDAAIAGDCHGTNQVPLNHYADSCVHGPYFAMDVCRFPVPIEDMENDTICYHGPIYTDGITFIYS